MTPRTLFHCCASWLTKVFLGVLSYCGKRLAKTAETLGITIKAVARDRDGKLLPA